MMGFKRSSYFFFFFCVLTPAVFSQKTLPVGYFRSPLDIRHYITGVFAEPRPDHLHSGIDFAVQQKIGLPIYAVADGYVSRIKVAPGGYGNALYLTHPNGFVSVYGHLNEYNVVVEDYIKRKQKEQETFEIELFPDPRLFHFNKGDVVGYAGNTGNSTGPHLHFEIRNEITERPINPALFGIYASDAQAPFFKKLMIYPYGQESRIKGRPDPVMYSFEKKPSGVTSYSLPDSVRVLGSCYLGVIARDLVSGGSDMGIYSLSLSVDGVPYFAYQLDSFSFDESRYSNDIISYRQYLEEGDKFLLLKSGKCNCLPIYSHQVNRGILSFARKDTLSLEIVASDVVGNKAVLHFIMMGEPAPMSGEPSSYVPSGVLFKCDTSNAFEAEGIQVEIPRGALFDSIWFRYNRKEYPKNFYPYLHYLDENGTPLAKPIRITLTATEVSSEIRPKVVLVRWEENNAMLSLGGTWDGDRITVSSYRFGRFTLAMDTVAPVIRPQNFSSGKNINGLGTLKLKVTDNLSGIKQYRAEINGEWVLMKYDQKFDLMTIGLDDRIPRGTFELKIIVSDNCDNLAEKMYRLTY